MVAPMVQVCAWEGQREREIGKEGKRVALLQSQETGFMYYACRYYHVSFEEGW